MLLKEGCRIASRRMLPNRVVASWEMLPGMRVAMSSESGRIRVAKRQSSRRTGPDIATQGCFLEL
jgi:hypothetical protein